MSSLTADRVLTVDLITNRASGSSNRGQVSSPVVTKRPVMIPLSTSIYKHLLEVHLDFILFHYLKMKKRKFYLASVISARSYLLNEFFSKRVATLFIIMHVVFYTTLYYVKKKCL